MFKTFSFMFKPKTKHYKHYRILNFYIIGNSLTMEFNKSNLYIYRKLINLIRATYIYIEN